jgi:hypothetical protein
MRKNKEHFQLPNGKIICLMNTNLKDIRGLFTVTNIYEKVTCCSCLRLLDKYTFHGLPKEENTIPENNISVQRNTLEEVKELLSQLDYVNEYLSQPYYILQYDLLDDRTFNKSRVDLLKKKIDSLLWVDEKDKT